MSRSLRGGAPTTEDDASPAIMGRRRGDQNGGGDDDDDTLLSIKVRSHDPVGEYEFSVSKTVRKCRRLSSKSISLSHLSSNIIAFFPRAS